MVGRTLKTSLQRLAYGLTFALVLMAASAPALAQASSVSFVLRPTTINSAGRDASSTSFAANGSLGQEPVVGVSSSPRFVLQSGFWSFGGSGLVPVVLHVTKNLSDPYQLDLQWSGNNPPYTLYRSTNCSNVFASVFGSESVNTHTDATPLPDPLSCYNVLATAPGPIVTSTRHPAKELRNAPSIP